MSRIIIEASGVIMERADINKPEEFVHDDYFILRSPIWNTVSALKDIIKDYPDAPIDIVVNIPYSLDKAREDIKTWLSWYLPEISSVKILPMGEYFGSYFYTSKTDVLISSNLADVALFKCFGGIAVGVDIDTDVIADIGYFNSNSLKEDIYDYLLFLLENLEGGNYL